MSFGCQKPVLDERRDVLPASRGPGSGPGRVSCSFTAPRAQTRGLAPMSATRPNHRLLMRNTFPATMGRGSLCVYHGLTPRRCALHRAHWKSAAAGAGPSGGSVHPYREIQHSHACLVRSAFGIRNLASARAKDQAVATRVETRVDHESQSRLERYLSQHPFLSHRDGPAHGRDG